MGSTAELHGGERGLGEVTDGIRKAKEGEDRPAELRCSCATDTKALVSLS